MASPGSKEKKMKIGLRGSLTNAQKRRLKNRPKTESSSARTFLRRIPKLFFLWRPRQSIPLGRIRGGRATQKVAPTKTRCPDPNFKFLRNPETAHESPALNNLYTPY